MSFMPVDLPATNCRPAQASTIQSLWRQGKRAYLVRRTSEHLVLIHRVDPKGAVISGGVICQLGEPVVLTLAGLGHIPGRIKDRCREGIEIEFDADPDLAKLIHALNATAEANYFC